MSSQNPNRIVDVPGREPAEDPAATSDQSRTIAAADTNATGSHIPQSFGSTGIGDNCPSSSIVPAIPGYVIEAELGRGGMGVVYRSRQPELNRPVAIKMILGGKYTDPVAQARFLIEAEVIAAIQHPHVVQVFGFGRYDDQPYFVLEFVGGGSLAARLKAVRRFTPREAATMVAKLADGMAAAHQKGVVHRDLKPANVLLTESGEPKIADFGLAKIGESEMTASGAVMGTPSYMSPEQAAGKTREVGTPTDVYALGAILYELATGKPPFKGATAMETIHQVLTQEPMRPRGIDPKIPRDLETICLKCMDKEAKKRYGTAAELATELCAFIDGRPIAARPVGLLERAWKWGKRNPGWAAGLAAAFLLLVLANVTAGVIREEVLEHQKAAQAAALVQRLLDAETAQVPSVIAEMSPYRQWTDPLLREENDKAATSRHKLHTSLALLPVDPGQVNYLYGRLLEAQPHEVPVIRDALAPHKGDLHDGLWTVVETPGKGQEARRLRAAAALAKYEPESQRWGMAGAVVVNDLVLENPVFLGQWSEALRPVKNWLLPQLSEIFRDHQPERMAERSLATNLLADYAADNPQVLADLLLDADDKQFALIYPKLKERSEQGVPLLTGEIDKKLPADLPSADEKRETLAKRQANAAVALLKMNQPEKVWPLLKQSPDPRVRSYLIHRLSPLGADAGAIMKRWDEEPELSIRRALLLSLGEYSDQQLALDTRQAPVRKVKAIYRNDADPGLHAAAEWLLRIWKQEPWLKQEEGEWAKDKAKRAKRLEAIRQLLTKEKDRAPPQWYVNGQGQTMVVIPGPVGFVMGSPVTDTDRVDSERQHHRKLARTFALAATPVTKEQFLRFQPRFTHYNMKRYPEPTCPIGGVIWAEAAGYCNWLSKEEGIPDDQWCYDTNPQGQVTRLKKDYLRLTGYRLPTEAEMEYATRAGAVTTRFYGETEELLRKYAWYSKNARQLTWPVGSLKPNGLGFFDVHGNVFEWCQESYKPYPQGEEVHNDTEDDVVIDLRSRVLRGGACDSYARNVRSADRGFNVPTNRNHLYGFRPARTFPLSSGAPRAVSAWPITGGDLAELDVGVVPSSLVTTVSTSPHVRPTVASTSTGTGSISGAIPSAIAHLSHSAAASGESVPRPSP